MIGDWQNKITCSCCYGWFLIFLAKLWMWMWNSIFREKQKFSLMKTMYMYIYGIFCHTNGNIQLIWQNFKYVFMNLHITYVGGPVTMVTCVESREANVISRFPFRPRSAGTSTKISDISTNTGQCCNNHNWQTYRDIKLEWYKCITANRLHIYDWCQL